MAPETDFITLEPVPMEEALHFWADKVKLSARDFYDLSAEARVKAFGVAGIAKGDELDTIHRAIEKALNEGTTFKQFQKDCAEVFEKRGWTGKRAYRTDNIFRTNIQTAYNVGHYKQLVEDADILPYWMYSAVGDKRTRPTHAAMNGRVWPANHGIWKRWYPPNGYA